MRIGTIGAFCLGAILLCGCATEPPHKGAKPAENTAAPAQPALPANTSEGNQAAKTALAGAGVGTLAGGDVGYYMDQQEKKLRQQLRNSGVSVTRLGDNIVLVLPGNLVFASNASDIAPNFQNTLNAVAGILKEYDKTVVNVTGHTDSVGSDAYNQGLSERRAGAVAQYLISQGLMAQRFVVSGMGKTQPIASNNTPDGRQANRRVEIKLSALTSS